MTGFAPPRVALLCLCCCGIVVPRAAAQDQVSRVKELYALAAYEEALAILDRIELPPGADTLEPAEYRVLCLLGLGQMERAHIAIEQLIVKHPRYQPDPSRFSPTVRAQFEIVRQRLLPQIIETEYAEAKASFDARDYRNAASRFELVLHLLNDAGNDPRVADLRTLASGFRELASAAAPPVGTTGLASNDGHASIAPSKGFVADVTTQDVAPPVPLKQILPPLSRDRSIPTAKPGLYEIVIDESGNVESAVVRRSINPQYDALMLREARNWRYQPAMRHGKAVKFRKLIEVYTMTLAPPDKR